MHLRCNSYIYDALGRVFIQRSVWEWLQIHRQRERFRVWARFYFGARHHASALARFMQPDRILIEKGRVRDPQQLNLYSYVRNNPLKFRDPTGMVEALPTLSKLQQEAGRRSEGRQDKKARLEVNRK
jgi:RHS repeat-associated protein